jgi:hypothetical protein
VTSIVACFAIVIRSGDLVGASMKAIAEFSTVLGIGIALRLTRRFKVIASLFVGLILRITAMSVMNIIVLPIYYGLSFIVAVQMLPMLGIFNAIQGAVTIVLGILLYEAYVRRFPAESLK